MQRNVDVQKILLLSLLVGTVLAGCGGEVPQRPSVAPVSDMVEVSEAARAALPQERSTFAAGNGALLYLNFDGGQITQSYNNTDDSASNTSYIGAGVVPPFQGDQKIRDLVVQGVKEIYRDFNIRIVTTRPTSEAYDMAMIGGLPSSIGISYGTVTGVAPMDCGDRMPRNISFVFSDNLAAISQGELYAQKVAESTAHESAHAYGLTHSSYGCDVMSYSACQQRKEFLDQELSLQSDSYGLCQRYSANSHALLLAALGPAVSGQGAGSTGGPQVTITSPTQGATVATRFVVTATASSDAAVTSVELLVDGQNLGTLSATPYSFDITVAQGQHTLTVNGYDANGNKGSATLTVTAGSGNATNTTPPAGQGDPSRQDLVEDSLGSHGAPCESGADCATGLCAEIAGSYGRYCTESCQPQVNACPSQASCVAATGQGGYVCGPPAVTLNSATNSSSSSSTSSGVAGAWLAGGCSLSASTRPDAGWALNALLLISFLVCRRRARR